MEDEQSVAITHFINPHLFWYKKIEIPGTGLHVLTEIEQKLLDLYKNKPVCDNLLRPQKGDKVAVNFIVWNKYIRAEILQKAEFQQEEYIVWALDYGFPLLTKKEFLRYLPTSLQADIGYIGVGGIVNVYPAEQEYDDIEGNLVMIKKDKWLQKPCNMLEKLLADASSVTFLKHYQTENGHAWGDLIIENHKGMLINARDYLIRTTNAIEEGNALFKTNCSKFKSIQIAPWLSNDRNTKLKYNNIKHNYVEHSEQINTALVHEHAKRKVEDWHERNKRNVDNKTAADVFGSTCELSEGNIDDVTFDDSVSMAQEQQKNYMGQAGILTKIKQQKYPSEKDFPAAVLNKFLEMDDMMFKLKCSKERQQSSGSNLKSNSNLQDEFCNPDHNNRLINFDSSCSSKDSSVKLRQKKLLEMRKQIARSAKDSKINKPTNCQQITNQTETNNTTSSLSKTLDSYPYNLLDQSSTVTTLNNTTIENEQDNTSESSVKNVRIKQLVAMRKKFGSLSNQSTDCSQINITAGSQVSRSSSASKMEKVMDNGIKNNNQPVNDTRFSLEPKIAKKPVSKNEIKGILESNSGYNSFTMVPAGFDVTRLGTYKNEENHWHRKKSTRNDYVPHDSLSSIGELLDHSVSSSNNSLNKSKVQSLKNNQFGNEIGLNNKTFKVAEMESDSERTTFSKQQSLNMKSESKNLSSEFSVSSNSSSLINRLHKRRQLKSPATCQNKIDEILQKHSIEKNLGNKHILDLQLLNSSSSSQKSLLGCTSSSDSHRNADAGHNDIVKCGSSHSSSSDDVRNEKIFKDIVNNEVLMDVKHTETLPIVEGDHKMQTKYIDHLVLAHSSVQLTPVENIAEAPFLPEIHEELLQMRVNKVYRIQVYSWSHISRNNSLFIINPSKSGKTWSYLPPLCSLICCRKDTFKPSYGPVAIILVASLKHVELINSYCRRLMSSFKNEAPKCVASYGIRNLIETKIHLLNGCEILVATPSNLLRLLCDNENENLFDADRLQHIVIDDMDIMMSRSQEDFEKAYSILFKMVKKTKFKKLLPQLIVTSRDWDGLLIKFIRKSNQPLLLIGDFLEAAVYGHATLSVKLKSNNQKNITIMKFLKEISESARTVDNRTLIICNNDEDVQNVHKFLQECGYCCLSLMSRSTETDQVTIAEWKRKVSSQILISSDARFSELKIQNVNNLIHYSLPTSWTQFTFRFSALARTYNNFVNHFECSTLSTANIATKKNNAYSMILLDENNNLQLPRLVEFMRKHNQKVKDEIQLVSKRILIMREEQRILNALCPQLLEFGECDESRCDYRHELTRFDVIRKGDNIPCSGEIRLHVLKVFSPAYYAVRLLHYKPLNTVKWHAIRRSSEALTFGIQLNMYYSDEKNLSLHWPPHINDICIYKFAENYRRARILEAPTLKENETNIVQCNLKVTLKLLDEGSVISSVKCSEIFLCDEKFKDFPSQAVDVRLVRVVPFDNERSWDSKTTKQVQKWIVDDIKSDNVVQANIDFAFANTIWVKNIVVMQKLDAIDAYRQTVNLKKSLVEKNFGVLYNGSRKQVRDLVEQFDLLNTFQIGAESADSDVDYQSCKNESEDLIKFSSSSSNDETANITMESAKTDLDGDKGNKLINLEEECKETKFFDEENMPTQVEENWDCINADQPPVPIYDPLQINRVEKVETTKIESWGKLTLNDPVKVEIGDEGENGNWENIFLQIIDKNSMFQFDELNKLIVQHVANLQADKENQQKIYDFKISHNCLIKYNNLYLRAKIYAIYGENEQRLYRFFLCDYACFVNAKIEELYNDFLYRTTDEIITFTPYQAIHCTLAGIKWDCFTKRYKVTKDYLYACAVVENDAARSNDVNLENMAIKSYKILLFECENEDDFNNASLFNKTLLDKGITLCDEKTKHFLEYQICAPETEKRNDNIVTDNEESDLATSYNANEVLSFEQLLELLKSDAFDVDVHDILPNVEKSDTRSIKGNAIEFKDQKSSGESVLNISDVAFDKKNKINEKSAEPTSHTETAEQEHCSSISDNSKKSTASSISADVSNCSASESLLPPMPFLKALYKRPLTTWYQNDYMIFLSVYAPDISNYHLEVTSQTLIFMATIQSEESALILNFLASVDPKSVSHEIRGLNVVVRLKKNVFIKWPRLLQQSTKYSWLKYNFNTFDSNEMEHILPQQVLYNMLDTEDNQNFTSYDSDEDSERELYQTYNPIQDNDQDDCDPFAA